MARAPQIPNPSPEPVSRTPSASLSHRHSWPALTPTGCSPSTAAVTPVHPTQWGKFEESVGNFAVALCLCAPFLSRRKMSESEETTAVIAGKAARQEPASWFSVRSPGNNEVFTVRAIADPQDGTNRDLNIMSFQHNLLCQEASRSYSSKSVMEKDEDSFKFLCRTRSVDEDSFKLPRRAHSVSDMTIETCETLGTVSEQPMCKLCDNEVADVVLLPCRHGGMCYRCFRRMLFMKPLHRGGSTCPFCRRPIREAVRISEQELGKSAACARYGCGLRVVGF